MTDESISRRASTILRAAAVQLTATPDTARNLETADRLVREAAGQGARLVVLPEKWSVLGRGEDLRAGAQPLDGEAISWACAVARQLAIDLVAGSVAERIPGEPKLRNTSVHIDPDGEIRATYRKIHLFDVEVDGTVYRESDHVEPGDEPVLSSTADGTPLGLSVCYDVRFPELYRVLAIEGARILTVPAAFTVPTTRDHWEILLRARAIENQCFVIAANQIGEHVRGLRSGGRSMIVDPWGLVLAKAPDSETVIVADLDIAAQDEMRARLPALAGRRPAAYARLHAEVKR